MFHFQEKTQRLICRAVFVALCAIPTAALLGYSTWTKTPLHRQAQASTWSQRTGQRVSVNQVIYPVPGAARLSDVELTDPHTGERIARIRELEVRNHDGQTGITAAQAEIEAAHLDGLWRQLRQRLLDESYPAADSVRLLANDVVIRNGGGDAQTLSAFEVTFTAKDGVNELTASYQLAGDNVESPALVRVAHRDGRLVELHWDTGDAALSVAPLAVQLPFLEHLGDGCTFRGEVSIVHSSGGLTGEIVGQLSSVDLDQLIGRQFPHKLSGDADVQIEASFADGRIVAASGTVAAGPGVIEQSLLNSAAEQWDLEFEGAGSGKKLVRYDSLALDFKIDGKEVSITGCCDGQADRTLLIAGDGRRWTTPDGALHNSVSLIRILSKPAENDVPATESTRQLIQWLPLPGEEFQQETNQPPQAHLHGGLEPSS